MTKEELVSILRDDYDYEVIIDNNIPMVIFRDHMNDKDIFVLEQIIGQVSYNGSWGYKRVVDGHVFRGIVNPDLPEIIRRGNDEEDSNTI